MYSYLKTMMDLSVELKRGFEKYIESEIELTYPQWRVMKAIRYSDSDISANEVAKIIGFDKVTVSDIVNRLVDKAFLDKRVDKNDRRRNVLFVSENAHNSCMKALRIEEKFNEQLFLGMKDDELENYLKTTDRLLARIRSLNKLEG